MRLRALSCCRLPARPSVRKKKQLPKLKTNRLVKLRDVSMRSIVPALQASRAGAHRRARPAALATPFTPPPEIHIGFLPRPARAAVLRCPAASARCLRGCPPPHHPAPGSGLQASHHLPCLLAPCQGPADIPDVNPRRLTLTFRVTKGAATGWDGKTENMLTQDAPYAVKVEGEGDREEQSGEGCCAQRFAQRRGSVFCLTPPANQSRRSLAVAPAPTGPPPASSCRSALI
jgi:hypothetical protein